MKSFAVDLGEMQSVAAAILDPDGVLLDANAGFLRLVPAHIAHPIGSRLARFFIQPSFTALAKYAIAAGKAGHSGLITVGDYAGTTRTLRARAWPTDEGIRILAEHDIADLEKLNDAILALNREASIAQQALARAHVTLKQREAQIVEASLTDALTGVGNRRRLGEALPVEISRSRRGGGALCAIIADIDHFKRVNDDYGHAAGDKVLARFGALLRSQTRSTDIVTRYGGEEFVILMPDTNLEQAAAKAEEIRRLVAAETIEPLKAPVTASFGVAELADGEDGDALVDRSDAALYRAKEGGRNAVVKASASPIRASPEGAAVV
jgi:diguanylate cyclase (GGDEF)-like protein